MGCVNFADYISSGCENAKVYIWKIPKDGLSETLTEPQSYLMGELKVYLAELVFSSNIPCR